MRELVISALAIIGAILVAMGVSVMGALAVFGILNTIRDTLVTQFSMTLAASIFGTGAVLVLIGAMVGWIAFVASE